MSDVGCTGRSGPTAPIRSRCTARSRGSTRATTATRPGS